MGISQSALSKLERRGDLQIGTLRRDVEHLGGRISVRVEFQDGSSTRRRRATRAQADLRTLRGAMAHVMPFA